MGIPTPLTNEADLMLSDALAAIHRGQIKEAELRIRQASDIVKQVDQARKDAIYVLNTGRPRQTHD